MIKETTDAIVSMKEQIIHRSLVEIINSKASEEVQKSFIKCFGAGFTGYSVKDVFEKCLEISDIADFEGLAPDMLGRGAEMFKTKAKIIDDDYKKYKKEHGPLTTEIDEPLKRSVKELKAIHFADFLMRKG